MIDNDIERDYGLERNRASLKLVIGKLCDEGFPEARQEDSEEPRVIFPDEQICVILIRSWCAAGQLDEAKRFAEEMRMLEIDGDLGHRFDGYDNGDRRR